MKKQLILAAAALIAASAPATAGDNGRTICVLRARPVAIQPVYRPAAAVAHHRIAAQPVPSFVGNYGYNGYAASNYGGYSGYPFYPRVGVIYGNVNPRLHYVSPCRPNGYVGGIQNLPTNYVQIPPSFTRAPSYYGPRPGYGGNGGNGGGGNGGGGGAPGGNGGGGGAAGGRGGK